MKIENLKIVVENHENFITGEFYIAVEDILDTKSYIDQYEISHIIGRRILNLTKNHLKNAQIS